MHDNEPEMPPELTKFAALLKPVGDAMDEGRFEDAQLAMLEVFQFVAEHPPEETPATKLRTEADEAEQRGDWGAVERLCQETLALESAGMPAASTHRRLGRLYKFLGQSEKAAEHGRMGFELCRNDDVEMVRVITAVAFARLASGTFPAAEIELALRSSLTSLPVGAIYVSFRAQALVELADLRRLQGDAAEAANLVDEAFHVIEPQAALNDLPGNQATISRAWRVRALTLRDLGNKQAAALAWKQSIECDSCSRFCFEDASPIEADEHSRYLYSAVEGLREAGEVDLANQYDEECRRIRDPWNLPALDVAGAFPRI